MSHSYSRASSYTFRNSSFRSLRTSASNVRTGVLREFLWWSNSSNGGGGQLEIDPEAITKQERLSRMLHAPKQHAPLSNTGPLYEHFVVVGLSDQNSKRPDILFHYPSNNPVTIPGLADFCFPSGIAPKKLRRTKSNSNLLQVLYSQSYHHEPENAFVFMLTTMEKELLYGVCVIKHESIHHKPSFFPRDRSAESARDAQDIVAPRCYCLVTRFPFFQLHFDTIYSLLDLEYMASVSDMHSLPMPIPSRMNDSNTPPLLHSTSLPSFPVEKKRKKIRLRSRSKGGNDEGPRLAPAQSESPFPGIPLHTVLKMPNSEHPTSETIIVTTVLEKDNRGRDLWNSVTTTSSDASAQAGSASLSKSLDQAVETEKPFRADAQRHSSSSAESGLGDEDAHSSSERDEPIYADDLSPDSRDRESGSEGGASPIQYSPRTTATKEWKLKALTGRGIVSEPTEEPDEIEGKEKEASTALDRSKSLSDADSLRTEKRQNPVLKVLQDYHALAIPKPNQTTTFSVHKGLPSLRFHRPAFHDQEHLLSEWSLPLTFHLLSLDNLLTFVTACLLEKKVVVHSTNVRFTSAVVLSIMPLLRPFTYQSVLIPVLPDMLLEFLEAPVPFLLGLSSAPSKQSYPKDVKDFVIIDLDNDKVTCKDTITPLPQMKDLRKKLKPLHKTVSTGRQDGKIPYAVSEEQMACCQGAALILQTYFSSLFINFRTYCLCDKTDSEKPITVFLKDSFLNDQPRTLKPFLSRFLETQLFFHYCDQRLRQLDSPSDA